MEAKLLVKLGLEQRLGNGWGKASYEAIPITGSGGL
jgi:hypothetical protein